LDVTALSGPLVLPTDVLLVPVAELAEGTRRQLRWQAGDVAITRPRLRTPSRLVDAGAAELLRQFVTPQTVVEAVIRHSRERGADPEATLEGAYPLLSRLVREGFLVPAEDAGAESSDSSSREGERIAGCTVLSCVQALDDSEIYQVRGGAPPWEAALKIERPRPPGRGFGAGLGPGGPAGAVDLAGDGRGRGTAAELIREAAVLDHLARAAALAGHPPIAPRLRGAGRWQDRRYLLLEWCAGVDAVTAAAEPRERGGEEGRAGVLALCRAVADTYARLHRLGVLHGDVHPRNVLVAAGGGVRLIDFGLARWRGAPAGLAPAERGGVAFYLEPEQAAALLAGRRPPEVSAAGEQYAVAALLYLLAAGAHYRDFSLERETMLRQIAAGGPLPFAGRGVAAWPELEAVLGRALATAPEDRFPSLDDFAGALRAIQAPAPVAGEAQGDAAATPPAPAVVEAAPSLALALRRGSPAAELLAETLAWVRPGGELWAAGLPQAPFASVQLGAAGIGLALYRIALAREDGELLPQADLWAARAAAAARAGATAGAADPGVSTVAADSSAAIEAADPGTRGAAPDDAFYNPRLDVTPETVGRASLFHAEPGVRCAQALIANALDDRAGALAAAAAFAAAAREPCPNPDLALGRSGLLLGCALLLETLGSAAGGEETAPRPADRASRHDDRRGEGAEAAPRLADLAARGDDLLAGLWQEIDPLPPIAECAEWPNLGIAHGWAGYLFATLRWCQAAGRPLPGGLAARLDELAAGAESWGRGARWRWHGQPEPGDRRRSSPGTACWMAGWCNGSAGMVHLWTLAWRLLGGPRWRQLAAAAAWHAWEAPDRGESLCCGLAGRAYALLELHRHGGGPAWLARARVLADRAASSATTAASTAPDADPAHSLYRGRLGIAVLAADLERPEAAAMPLFGDEGWTAR